MRSAECLSFSELVELADDESHIATEHLSECVRCQALLKALGGKPSPPAKKESPFVSLGSSDVGITPGAVVSVTDPAGTLSGLAIVIAELGWAVDVVPLSDEVRAPTEMDVFLPTSLLGYDAIAQTAHRGQVLREQIHDVVAVDAALAETVASPSDDALTGPPVIGDQDPRLQAGRDWGERHQALFAAARALAEDDLGAVVEKRRKELRFTPDGLAAEADVSRETVDSVERGHVPLPSLAPRQLAALLGHLALPRSVRLRELVRSAIGSAGAPLDHMASGPSSPIAARFPSREAEDDSGLADHYAEQVMFEMGERN